ncbi:MAG: hypothetical protein ACYC1H_00620 [Rectinema subterraneum]
MNQTGLGIALLTYGIAAIISMFTAAIIALMVKSIKWKNRSSSRSKRGE